MRTTEFERRECRVEVGRWYISAFSAEWTGEAFGRRWGDVRWYPTAEAAAADLPAARAAAAAAGIDYEVTVTYWLDHPATERATDDAIRARRDEARKAAKKMESRIRAAVESRYPAMGAWWLPVEGNTLDDLMDYPRRAVAVAASRISEVYGLGLGSEWAAQFGLPGDETAALAGHVGWEQAREMTRG